LTSSFIPDGVINLLFIKRLALNYGGLTPFIIKAIQELDIKVTAVTGLTEESGIREALRGWLSDTANGITEFFAGRVKTNELCVGSVCVTESQFLQMVQQSGQTGGSSSSGTVVSGGGSSDTGDQTIEGDLTSDTQGTPDENSDSTGDPENSPASEPTETI
jgi:hypothetical protein